eukprot:2811399-Pleurochrysis_carterae.AAC.6
MKPNSAAKLVFQSTLKHWVRSRPTLAKWLRLLEHDYTLQLGSPDRTARQGRDGGQGPRRCQHCPSSTPSFGARDRGIKHRRAPLRRTATTPSGAPRSLAARCSRCEMS